MGITVDQSSQDKVLERLAKQAARLERALLRQFLVAGEMCVETARLNRSYTDRTGNLTSSIGYIVAVDGRIRKISDFYVVKQGAQGQKEGKAYARELVKNFPKGYVLIIVAGMEYAAYVADKGYDVIDSAELQAQTLVPQLLRQLKIDV